MLCLCLDFPALVVGIASWHLWEEAVAFAPPVKAEQNALALGKRNASKVDPLILLDTTRKRWDKGLFNVGSIHPKA